MKIGDLVRLNEVGHDEYDEPRNVEHVALLINFNDDKFIPHWNVLFDKGPGMIFVENEKNWDVISVGKE